jgi:hypothetical protein
MIIACLGWGSLIWDQRDLPVQGLWLKNGPFLPIEFARQSNDDRITLVCVPGFKVVQSLWSILIPTNLSTAREALRVREGIPRKNLDDDIGVWTKNQITSHSNISTNIGLWASSLDLDAVIWTNLPPKFQGENGRIPSVEEVISHLLNLKGQKLEKAERYVRMAPRQIQTNNRSHIEKMLGWLPAEGAV